MARYLSLKLSEARVNPEDMEEKATGRDQPVKRPEE